MKIAIIGGPLLHPIWGLKAETADIQTPFGFPSDKLYKIKLRNHEIITLLRHGKNHQFSPTDVPYLANVFALATCHPDFVIQINACGSLNKNYNLGDIFLFNQIIDFTKKRPHTFGDKLFEKVVHIDFNQPVSMQLHSQATTILRSHNIAHQSNGTLLVEEGPQFSTTAESKMYRLLGADAINQTACPELYLFRELGLPTISMSLIVNKIMGNSSIDINNIVDNLFNLRNVIPNAVKLFIENIPEDFIVEKPKVAFFDISKLFMKKTVGNDLELA